MNVLAFTHPGTNSRGLLLDIIWGYKELGHNVVQFELAPYMNLYHELNQHEQKLKECLGKLMCQFIPENNIDFSIAMWANAVFSMPGVGQSQDHFTAWLNEMKSPHVQYWWDAPQWAHSGQVMDIIDKGVVNGKYQFHYINNQFTGAEMANIFNMANVIPAPNGVNPNTFKPHPEIKPEYDLVFMSGGGDPKPTKIMLEEIEKDNPDINRIRKDLAVVVQENIKAFVDGCNCTSKEKLTSLLNSLLEIRLENRHSPALHQIQTVVKNDNNLATAAMELLQNPRDYVQSTSILRNIENWERPFLANYLSRHFKCLLLGSQDYSDWNGQASDKTMIDYYDQFKHYARAQFSLNAMRWQDDCSLNSKIFEITACRCACLQAYRFGVEELFEDGKEILVFKTPKEAREILVDALNTPGKREEIAEAGYRRTLNTHTWAHRAQVVIEAIQETLGYKKPDENVTPITVKIPDNQKAVSELGDKLAFIISPMRSGSTMFRVVLDGHPRLVSPAESWFMLPLLNIWDGKGTGEGYKPQQAAVAMRTLVDDNGFIDCCRSFASRLYSKFIKPGIEYVIDKTPFYINIAEPLIRIFPHAKFIVLTRDPRAIVWSMHTWEKIKSPGIDNIIQSTAKYIKMQCDFASKYKNRILLVQYEQLCENPVEGYSQVCKFLGVQFNHAMLSYGKFGHHAGYGDEKTQCHTKPHLDSLRRWENNDNEECITEEQQAELACLCGQDALNMFGYNELANMTNMKHSMV